MEVFLFRFAPFHKFRVLLSFSADLGVYGGRGGGAIRETLQYPTISNCTRFVNRYVACRSSGILHKPVSAGFGINRIKNRRRRLRCSNKNSDRGRTGRKSNFGMLPNYGFHYYKAHAMFTNSRKGKE